MFNISCFVDDKKLAHVLTMLDGWVIDLDVRPVKNAMEKEGKIVADENPSSLKSIAKGFIAPRKGRHETEVDSGAISQHIKANSLTTSVAYMVRLMIEEGLISRTNRRGWYRIL